MTVLDLGSDYCFALLDARQPQVEAELRKRPVDDFLFVKSPFGNGVYRNVV